MSLRDMRERAGLSQDELAAKSGLSQAQISQLERGQTRNPGVSTLMQLADALGVPLHHVIAAVVEAA
jgi:transcriptional regulator with XRE-family HTH domain